MSEKLVVFDTTLRDGEQSPGVALTISQKVEIAKHLSKLGVDVCEIGFPANPADFEGIENIVQEVGSLVDGRTDGPMKLAVLARCVRSDIDSAFRAVQNCPRRRIHVFYGTSDIHLKFKLKKTKEQALEAIEKSVAYARSLVEDVEFSAEDAGRTDLPFLVQVCETAIKAGASTINIPDTVGCLLPHQYSKIIECLISSVSDSDKVIWSTHCHNDLGVATANALAGVYAGARQVEVTVNGIGERAGNTALEEIVMAIHTHPEQFDLYHSIQIQQLLSISRLVVQLSGMEIQNHKALVGKNAFRHESGVHADGMLKNRSTYEFVSPLEIGWSEEELHSGVVLGKTSGSSAYRSVMQGWGISFRSESHFLQSFDRFKRLYHDSTPTSEMIRATAELEGCSDGSPLTNQNQNSIKDSFNVIELIGDGVSSEITREAIKVLQTVAKCSKVSISFEQHLIGGACIDEHGVPITENTLEACHRSDGVLLGAVGDPRFDNPNLTVRPEQGLLRIRKEMGLYQNLRPVSVPEWLEDSSPLKNQLIRGTDFIIVRELTGGIYNAKHDLQEDHATDLMVYYVEEIERIARRAAELAMTRRKKVTSIHKANVLACSRLWKKVTCKVFEEFPQVQLEHLLVDSAAIHLLKRPFDFDVILCPNLFGDILSDEAAALTCSLGMLPSASLGDSGKPGLFEPVHGSAPDIAGKGIVNPTGAILSGALLLRHGLGLEREAEIVEKAMDHVLCSGIVTADIARRDQISVSTKALGDAVCERIVEMFAETRLFSTCDNI